MSEGVAGNEKEGVRERGRGRERKKEDLVSRSQPSLLLDLGAAAGPKDVKHEKKARG